MKADRRKFIRCCVALLHSDLSFLSFLNYLKPINKYMFYICSRVENHI